MATNYADIYSQINKARDTNSTPTMQSPDYLSNAAQGIYRTMQPAKQQMEASIGSQYSASARQGREALARTGNLRGGAYERFLNQNAQGRNRAYGQANSDLWSAAMNQAVPAAQLALSERGQQYNQQSNAANQYLALMGQQTGAQQFQQQLGQQESQYGRSLAEQIASRTGSQDIQRQQLAQQASQFGMSLAEQQAARQQQYGLSTRQLEQQGSQFGQSLAEQQAARQYAEAMGLRQQGFAETQAGFDQGLREAALTGNYGGQKTLTGQQFEQSKTQAGLDEAYRQAVMQNQNSQFAQQLGLQQTAQQNQQSQFNQNYALQQALQNANIQNQGFNQNLAGYQASLGAILGFGQLTGQLNSPSGFYPGDTLKQYQQRLMGSGYSPTVQGIDYSWYP